MAEQVKAELADEDAKLIKAAIKAADEEDGSGTQQDFYHSDLLRQLASALTTLAAEKAEAERWIAETTRLISDAVGGGSELFTRKGDVFRLDAKFCSERIRERAVGAHERTVNAIRDKRAAEAKLAEAERERDELRELAGRLNGGSELQELMRMNNAAEARIAKLTDALTHCLGLIVEFGDLNGFRNMSDEELGRAVSAVAEDAARALQSEVSRT